MSAQPKIDDPAPTDETVEQLVTFHIGGQVFGLPIGRVHEVFAPDNITRVPLSHTAILGVLNLRGRVVTAIDMRCLLGLPSQDGDASQVAVGIENKGESYGLIVDRIGEVMQVPMAAREANPANLDEAWSSIAAGVYRLDKTLLVFLNIDKVLAAFTPAQFAA